jgi:hypothetical protein
MMVRAWRGVGVMKWMRERDLLIAQTMAFVQSVGGRKPEAEVFARTDIRPVTPTRLPDVEAMLTEALSVPAPSASPVPEAAKPLPPAPVQPMRAAGRSEYQSEIQARVEKFRAHQAKFNREREAYCSATMARMQATLDKYPVPRPSK